ncbi:winged helix-turn-helix domain-containing protein [Lentzea sp. NPDC006480]|uniref:ArsR/SmtB family transcription factor n=1 Tax=Lentzea sp. NPDC006480 TaxID=3157176 RepID=UPI0033A1EE47
MPQLRVHFTDRDLAHTRLKLETDLLWEILSSAQILQQREDDLSFGPWRRHVRELAARDQDLRMALHTVVTMTPQDLALGPPRQALLVYYRSVIEPHLPAIEHGLCTEVAAGIQQHLHHGAEGLLGVLGPATRWEPPVLSVDHPHDVDLHLGGRGLVLVPCYFAVRHQVVLGDPRALVCPIRPESRLRAGRAGDHVTALLGATRAAILRSVVGGCTTSRLAKQVGVAPATVSHHTGVLREAGLIATEREENFARHVITPLGLRVLTAGR